MPDEPDEAVPSPGEPASSGLADGEPADAGSGETGPPDEDATLAVERPGGWRSVLVLGLAAVVVIHTVLVALWLAPAGPVRDAAGPSRLAFYVNPYFQQSWDVLEPSAQQVDEALWVRARVRVGEDDLEQSDWVNVTQADLDATRLDVAPGRIRVAARRLATSLNGSYFELGEEGRRSVAASYAGKDPAALRGVLSDDGVRPAAIDRFARLDEMATRFASLYTQAGLEQRVVQVQYRVGRRTVPPREERADRRVADEEFALFNVGWRSVDRGSESAQAAFDDFVRGR